MNDVMKVIEVENFEKTFAIGFFRKKVHAVRGITFSVKQGETFGLLGPNGAGKTTTIKSLLGLIKPSEGSLRVFGYPANDPEASRRTGYMPENPYVYQYLKPLEFLDLCGRLIGMSSSDRRKRSEQMVEQIGLTHAIDRPIGRFSKGMTQRIGLAQALLHDPELLVLDEPMSGLDPVGRRQVRDILMEQKRAGKTLLFTSHILSDVEMLCDRMVILKQGLVAVEGSVHQMVDRNVRHVDIELARYSDELKQKLSSLGQVTHDAEGMINISVQGQDKIDQAVALAVGAGAEILAVSPKRENLEDLFMRDVIKTAPSTT